MRWSLNDVPNDLKEELIKDGYTEYQATQLARLGFDSAHARDFIKAKLRTTAEPIDNMPAAVNMAIKAIENKEPITIFGDYDVDGITSTYILKTALKSKGANVRVMLPDRFDGYGISMDDIAKIKRGLVITVDNGVSAIQEIKAAKDKGLKVIVLDHHQPKEALPDADVLVDLHISGSKYPFKDFCAAGLAAKFAQMMGKLDSELLQLAAIGTIADMVPLVDENRFIVKQGLALINKALSGSSNEINLGLGILLNAMKKEVIDESDISFTIAPMLNASGRMISKGAEIGFNLFDSENAMTADFLVNRLLQSNEDRKLATETGVENALKQIDDNCFYGDPIFVIYDEDLNEGIAGLVAGRIREKFNVPTIVLSKSTENGIVKGSGRSVDNIDLLELVTQAKEHLTKFGGHKAAIGLSLKESDVDKFRDKLINILNERGFTPDSISYGYDFELSASEVEKFCEEISLLAPFGMANPNPIIVVKDFLSAPNGPTHYRLLGDGEKHVKLFGEHFDVLCFSLFKEYKAKNYPRGLKILGTTSYNYYNGKRLQVVVRDFETAKNVRPTSKLQEALQKAVSANI